MTFLPNACKHDDVIFKSREFCKFNNFELVGHESSVTKKL